MEKRCRAFPTEYQHEFTKRKLVKLEPFRPVEDWETKVEHRSKSSDDSSQEELIKKLILDRYKTAYQFFYDKDFSARENQEEEIDLGNELVLYLKNLYYKPHTEETPRLPFTAGRVCGYASPQTLHGQLSVYQDTYGRTGGKVILKNVQRIIASKRRQIIQSKLRANVEGQL